MVRSRLLIVFLAGLTFAALSAFAPASAFAGLFEAEEYSASVSASPVSGESVFGFESSLTAKCKKESLSGTLGEASETLSLHPTYSECAAFGLSATVTTTGCNFNYHVGEPLEGAGEEAEKGEEEFEGSVDVSCESGKSITFVAGTCELKIGAQTGLTGVTPKVDPKAEPLKLKLASSLTGIAYTKLKDGFLCPLSGTGAKTDGTFSGEELASATIGAEQVGVRGGRPVIEFLPKAPPAVEITAGGAAREIKIKNTRAYGVEIIFNAPQAFPFTGPEAGSNCGLALVPPLTPECKDFIAVAAGTAVGTKGKLIFRVRRPGRWEWPYTLALKSK